MRLKEFEIVIEPREIVFEHIQANRVFTKTLNIKNVGNKSKRMELFRPGNKVFKLEFQNPELPVPPGMEISAKINFETNISQDYNEKMIVCIDNNEIEIPIQAFPAKPILKIDEKVDFGTQSASNKTISANFKISNIGAIQGEFSVNYQGKYPITFVPAKDTIPAYSDAYIRVDFFTKFPSQVEEKVEIHLRGSDKPLVFKVLAFVMEKQLILLNSENNEPINRIDFGSCYYGCNLTNLVILYNSSPEKVDYVILLEERGVGSEIGAEFSKSTKALKATENDYKEEDFCPLSKLITAFPNNGTLEPFEKRPIFFRFSPECIFPKLGFSTTLKPPQRRDYAVFVYLEQVGDHKKTEIAITGTALPILLKADPNKIEFGVCEIGQKKEIVVNLLNDSELKNVKFKFCKVANYIVNPASGNIMPKNQKSAVISFVPNQIGTFKYTLLCEVIDKLVDKTNPLLILDRGITNIPIHLSGTAIEIKKIGTPKYSGGQLPKNFAAGIDPLLTNEVGLNVNTTLENLKAFVPKAAVQNAVNDQLHKFSNTEKVYPGTAYKHKIAFPNDRSKSIGPFDKREKYKTIFTGIDRYNYIDPDYAYTDAENEKLEKHKDIYKKYLESLKFHRVEKIRNDEYLSFNEKKNIGIKPAGGLKAQELSLNELIKEANRKPDFESNNDWKLISSDDLSSLQQKLRSSKESSSRLNVLSSREREKLSVQLTPAQIYKIIVSPLVIDFGEVCVKSTSSKNLEILNSLDQPIYVELENDSIELRQTSPLSQVIQPHSKGIFSITFESEVVQTFQRSISYRINYSYRHHIIVLAESKLQSLKLSKNHVVLNQLLDVQPEVCYRTNITVTNPYNTITEFTWMPIYGEQGTAFSIRPATGIIEPFKDIDCEIVWHGSYLAPLTGTFSLLVTGGESNTLTCEAKLGSPQLQFISRRAQFGKIPINMSSVKTFYITNNGTNNAFFQILDPKPIQGMTITPTFGMAPLNALTPIKVEINPTEILKFDARIMVQVRGSKTLELRFGGESEEPIIDIDIPNFEFGGVYSGATCSIPFRLINTSTVKGKVEFNLKKFPDFTVKCSSNELKELGKNYEIIIQPEKILNLELIFNPTEIASYDFDLPITINKPAVVHLYSSFDQMTPYPSSSEFMASQNGKTPATRSSLTRNSIVNYAPKRRITAIALRNAIKLSEMKINFKIPIMYYEKLKEGGFYEAKSTTMSNHSNRNIKWCFDMRNSNKITEQGVFKICNGSMVPFVNPSGKSYGPEGEIKPNEKIDFKILFCPDKPGTYFCKIPIVVNENFEQPYYNIEIIGELLAPEITFDPEVLTLKPVPIGIEVVEKFTIKHVGYENDTKLFLNISETKSLDGEPLDVLTVKLPNNPVILPKASSNEIEVEIKFNSPKPISTVIKLTFSDEQNREYNYRVIVTADNSMFTCYAFLADHLFDFHIVLEEGHIMKGSRTSAMPSEMSGEPILRPYSATSKYSQTQTGSPTFEMQTSQSVQSRMKDIEADMRAALNDEAMTPNISQGADSRMSTVFTKGQEPLLFPSNEINSGVFAYEILKILQRWFRCNGWPNCLNLVKIPDSFRGCVSRKPFDENQEKIPQQDAVKRENKTIYEMITYLSGRPLPAIPVGSLVPNDLNERTNQFHWQHNVLLKFLQVEGGCVSHIRPEHLLDTYEYKSWLEQNEKQKELEESSGYKTTIRKNLESAEIPIHLFQLVSRKAWLDLLLQLIKVCVLNRITAKSLRTREVPYNDKATFPYVKSDPLISNIYSMGERVLLTWLNYLYNNFKEKIWSSNDGNVPTTRWIVNFDIDLTDSLTLAAVIGAYCPFVIDSHLKRMYVMADTAEKCFHNALILIDSIRELGLDYDINSLDITDPNPIGMILFCAYLYDKLPNYMPSASIEFSSPLHQIVTKKIKISNPNAKNIFYQASIIGNNAMNFSLPNGNQMPLAPKASIDLAINYIGNNLKSASAYLLLNGKKQASIVADTLVFKLNANIDELTPAKNRKKQKTFKLSSPLYELNEIDLEAENPYDQGGEFRVSIIESPTKNGIIRNPFSINSKKDFIESISEFKLPTIEKSSPFKQNSKSSFENNKHKTSQDRLKDFAKEEQEPKPHLSAFATNISTVQFDSRGKQKLKISYLPLQLVKHSAIILFTNETLGEFLYNLEGVVSMPEKSKIIVDESNLDSRVKLIKTNRNNNNVNMFRCYAGDKIEVKFLVPVCNLERESAIILAAEIRMSDLELKRRKLHGGLSSKSLLEALEKLTLNKDQIEAYKEKNKSKKISQRNNSITYTLQSKNNVQFQSPLSLKIEQDDVKFDNNLVPLTIRFSADRPGSFATSIEMFADSDDIRTIPIEFKVTESSISESNTAYLEFNTSVFESTVQQIPIKNNSDIACNYEVEIIYDKNPESEVFLGLKKFMIRQKEIFHYDLTFSPISEEKYEAELRFNNVTEGIQLKYHLTGNGERSPPLGEIKLDTKVGQMTQHEISIPNKSNKKICYHISSSSNLVNGPNKLMILPNKKELYKFDILPTQRGEYKGTVTFKPGEWPIKDIDSDGEEIVPIDQEEKPQNFTLWFTFDLKVQPLEPQSIVEIKTNSMEAYTLVVPLYNPFDDIITLNVKINGQYLEGEKKINIKPKEKFKYLLEFNPIQIGKYRGSLIFMNETYGEFWYDLRLTSLDPLPIQLEPIKAEVGRFAIEAIKLKNPLNENIQFKAILSASKYFSFERRQIEYINVNANDSADVNVIFIPAAVGYSDHYAQATFTNEKIGKLVYELSGMGIEPDLQDPINITSEIGQSQIVTINFRNSTDSAIYCDITLKDENFEPIIINTVNNNQEPKRIFNILLESLQNVHLAPRSILEIPVMFCPDEMKKYSLNLIVSAKREAQMSWLEPESKQSTKIEKLKWIYPIKAFAVINAISKASPFVLECMVRKRLEKRMEVIISDVSSYSSGLDKSAVKLRSITPQNGSSKSIDNLIIIGDVNNLANEFMHSIQFSGNSELSQIAQNSIAMKLIRSQRDKNTGLLTLVFDFIFCPSQSFITDAYLQIETAVGGMWRYPIKLIAIEAPPDDVILIEVTRLNREFSVGFKLSSKNDKPLPFKAEFIPPGDHNFSVFPSSGELLPESEDGTLIRVGFTSPSYGKIYQTQLIISTPIYQWKYQVKGVTSEYRIPRGHSGIPRLSSSDPRLKRTGKKKNYVVENTYIIQTAVSSPIKGAALLKMKYSNKS